MPIDGGQQRIMGTKHHRAGEGQRQNVVLGLAASHPLSSRYAFPLLNEVHAVQKEMAVVFP